MKHDSCVVRLEKKLSLDKQRVIEFLNAVVAGLVEELVEKGEVSVKGLGYFKVVYIPFRKQKQGDVIQALPPRKKIVFLTRPVADTGTRRIICSKTGLAEKEAETFNKVLSGYFRDSVAKRRDLLLEGLGSFSEVEGKYIFVPDQVLQEIVDNGFEHLPVFEVPIQ